MKKQIFLMLIVFMAFLIGYGVGNIIVSKKVSKENNNNIIIEPGTIHKEGEPIGNSKKLQKLQIPNK